MTDDWTRAAPLLEPALDGSYTLDDVRAELAAGRAQLWTLPQSAVVTQVHHYPRLRVLRVWLAGGDLDELRRNTHRLDDVARQFGCDAVELEARKGWSRVMDDYDTLKVVLRKEL